MVLAFFFLWSPFHAQRLMFAIGKFWKMYKKKCSFNPSRNDISLYIVIKITKKGNEKNTSSTHSIYIIFTSDI